MTPHSLIACWELGRRRHALDRALLLHAAAAPAEDAESLADRTIGERNGALLAMRSRLFGDALASCVDCPECGERLEFALSARLLGARAPGPERTHAEIGGIRVRLPTSRDLAHVAGEPDEANAVRKLTERLTDGAAAPVTSEQLAAGLDAADPRIDVNVALACPACSHAWCAPFDVPAFLWEELDVRARRLLDEVHTLALAYHWSESEILAMSDVRRRAYLERVLA